MSVRSILSVPGHQEAMVRSARSRGADLIAWDLEDSVPRALKVAARATVAEVMRAGDAVRVNAWSVEDVRAIRALAGWINLPKVCGALDVQWVRSLAPGAKILAVIESTVAVTRLAEICAVADAVAFGRADFCAEAELLDSSSPLVTHAMAQIVMAAKARGIPSYDSPCEVLSPGEMLREVERARSLGFTGKICIHPDQVLACRLFGPSGAEVDEARMIAGLRGSGGQRDGNRVLAEPHFKLAEAVLR